VLEDISLGGGFLKGLEQVEWPAEKRKLPPVHKWNPPLSGDLDMRIARDGSWHYLGSPIRRMGLVHLFASVLRRDPDGHYYLVTPAEKVRIRVDDAPFVAVTMEVDGTGQNRRLTFRTNVGDEVTADAEHPIRIETDPETGEPSPYVLVRDRLEALIARSVFYDLVALAEEDEAGTFNVWSGGCRFPLGEVGAADLEEDAA
jgi:uncharacterized protein